MKRIFAILIGLGLISACGSTPGNPTGHAVASAVQEAVPAVSPTPALVVDAKGKAACDGIKAAIGDTSKILAEHDLQPIVDAGSQSPDFDISHQSILLGDQWDDAKAAGPSNLPINLNLLTDAINLETACAKAGF